MKKLSVLLISIVIVAISILSEIAFSVIEQDDWSNYTHSWETKWTTPVKYKQVERAVAENKITICNSKLLTNKN